MQNPLKCKRAKESVWKFNIALYQSIHIVMMEMVKLTYTCTPLKKKFSLLYRYTIGLYVNYNVHVLEVNVSYA